MITVHTDGSCLGNPGPGGWAAAWEQDGSYAALADGEPHTTNIRMEMTAALRAIEHFPAGSAVEIVTDSEFTINVMTKWLKGWKKKGWKTGSGKPVANLDLVQALDAAVAGRRVTWTWVKGHNGDTMNEVVDQLAREQAMAQKAAHNRRKH